MVKHIVLWKLKESWQGRSVAENALEVKRRLEALNGRIPGMIHLEVGVDTSRLDCSADVALYSEFVDQAALDGYQKHPEHLAAASFVREAREVRLLADYEV